MDKISMKTYLQPDLFFRKFQFGLKWRAGEWCLVAWCPMQRGVGSDIVSFQLVSSLVLVMSSFLFMSSCLIYLKLIATSGVRAE